MPSASSRTGRQPSRSTDRVISSQGCSRDGRSSLPAPAMFPYPLEASPKSPHDPNHRYQRTALETYSRRSTLAAATSLHAPKPSLGPDTGGKRLSLSGVFARKINRKWLSGRRLSGMRSLDRRCPSKILTRTAIAVVRGLAASGPTSPRFVASRRHAGSWSAHRAGSGRAVLSGRLRYRQRL